MTVKIGINGFGRIGRLVARALSEYSIEDVELVAINSPGAIEVSAHLLRYDSVHGRFLMWISLWSARACFVQRGFMTTVHSYTQDQRILDNSHKDLYRARAAGLNMIPTSTGAAKAVGLVLPELLGKLAGSAVRVPTANVSMVDLAFQPQLQTTAEDLNAAVKSAADGHMKGVLRYTEEALVSSDLNHDPHSAIFAAPLTKVLDGNLVRVVAWYDNEWGFANRMIDVARAMGTVK